jgi:hypothetical protein
VHFAKELEESKPKCLEMKRLAILAMAQDGRIDNRKSGKREAA